MKNNKGYSLIEILIVIAILGVVASTGSISFNMIYNTRVTTSSRTIQSYCKSARLNNMTKAKLSFIHIFKDDGRYYVYTDDKSYIVINDENKKEPLGSTNMSITYVSGESTEVIREDEGITIDYNRSGQSMVIIGLTAGGAQGINELIFKNKARESTIKFSTITGKTILE